jgi:AcrR family transcriptional regulator
VNIRKSPSVRRREVLIKAGLQLFSNRAYEEISIDEIADAVDMSKGLLYYYYPTKRDFFIAVVQYAADELIRITEADPTLPPMDQLRYGVDEYLRYVSQHATTYTGLLRGGAGLDQDTAQISGSVRQTNMQRTLRQFSEADQASHVLQLAIAGWIGTVEFMSLAWLKEGVGTHDSVLELSMRAFLSALRDAKAADPALTLDRYAELL